LLVVPARKTTSVKSPSNFIAITDAAADGNYDFLLLPFEYYPPPPFRLSVGDIHRGGANVLFCDGHVEWFLKNDVVVQMPVGPGDAFKQRRWNITDEPFGPW
jgi:prepilin-type processing-associated H-X9-DG protein